MNTTFKVTKDMFIEQLKWSAWFIITNIIIHLVLTYFSVKYNFGITDFTQFMGASITIYMLIIGIIAGSSFLRYYSRMGITRKDYFYGAALAIIILTFTLVIIVGLWSLVEISIFNLMDISIKSNIFYGMNWVEPAVSIVLSSLIYYLIGWFINVGYYKFNWKVGLLFILVSMIILSIHGKTWVDELVDIPVVIIGSVMVEILNITKAGFEFWVSLAINFGLIILLMFIIRRLTKSITVKL